MAELTCDYVAGTGFFGDSDKSFNRMCDYTAESGFAGSSDWSLNRMCDYTVQPGSSTVTHYRLRGYRPGSSDFESWIGTSTTTPNPSGQTITDIVVIASWTTSS